MFDSVSHEVAKPIGTQTDSGDQVLMFDSIFSLLDNK